MNNKNIKLQELKRWLKTSLKNKVSINQKTVITYLMLGIAGFFGLSLDLRAAWVDKDEVKYYVNFDGDGRFIASGNNRDKALIGSVIIANSNNINVPLGDSVVLGYKASVDIEAPSTLTINGRFATNFNKGIIALGNVKISNNPYELGRTGNGGQSIAIGDFATSTSQSVAIGSDTYSIGGSSIAIGGDDIASYTDSVTTYDYNTYFKRLYDKIGKYNSGSIYSPNVAGGEGSISIGSRTVAYKEGSTSLGTMAYALGKGATALGTQSRAEGIGSIAIGNLTRNFADQALAIGNDSQIRKKGGTAVGLKANSAGEGAIAIGTEVYANASISDGIKDIKNKSIDEAEGYLDNLRANTIKLNDISGIVKNRNETNINDSVSISSEDLDKLNKDNKLSKNAIVIGTKSAAVGDNSIVIGRGSFAFSKNSFALGSYSYAEAENGSAIGIGAKSISYDGAGVASNSNYMHTGKNAMAIGNNSVSSLENSVALGFKSRTDYLHSDLLKPGWVPEGATSIPSSGKTGVISVGAKGFERRIVNVAPGYRGTDAVNVDQLKTLVNRLENKQYNSNLSVQYLSVEKTKGDAKDISDKIELNSKYLEYLDLKEQLEIIKARNKFKDEEIVESTKKVIEDRIKELEKNSLIKTTAGDMGTYSSDSITVGSTQNENDKKFEEFISNLKAKKDKALEEENKKPLFGNKTLKDVLANTNYNNDGASGKDSLAFGYKASTSNTADKSISIGYMTTSQSSNSIAIGSKGDDVTKASGTASVAIGQGAQTTGGYSLGIGGNVRATGATSIAIGDRTSSEAANSIAIGSKGDDYTKASGTSSIAIGQGAQTTGEYALGIGGNVSATSKTSIAIGDRAKTTGISSVAVGPAAQGLGENSVAIGNGSKAEFKNSVALGSGVTAQESEGNGYLTNQPFSDKGKVVSVGYRRINQLADGKEDNEAVTVAQLKSAAPEIEAEVGNKISTVPGANIKVQSGNFNGKDNLRYVGENISTHIGGSTSTPVISVGIKEEPKFKTLKLNNKNNNAKDLTLSVDNNGNLNLATNNTDTKAKITNVANGTADNDAVNYSQLIGAAPILQAQNSANLTDNKLSTSIGATIKVQADNWGSGDSRYVGENLSTYIGGSASAPVLSIGLKENPKFKTLKINNGVNNSQDLTLSADNTGNLSIGSKKITNVANGTDNNDAVNLSQLKGAKSKVEAVANSGITVNAGTAGADGTTYTVGLDVNKVKEIAGTNNKGNVTSSDITITNGNGRLIGGDAMTLTIANNAITKDKIKNGAVTADKLDSDLNTKINNSNTVASNVIRFTGDETSKTDDVALSKQGGIEFAINGKLGEIVTKASGNKVEIGLNSSLKDKLDKLAADPNATYATKSENTAKADKTLANLEESGKNVIKDEAGKAVKVTAGTGTKVETTTNNHITTYRVSLGEEISNKIDGALSKTEASNTYVTKTDVVDTKIKYTANTNTSKKEIKLSEGFDFKDGTNTTAEVEDNGVVKFNLKSDLTGITSISAGENKAKLTLDDNITVNSKKITGLTDAELNGTSTDAVTGKQLNTTNTNVTNLTSKVDGISNNITTLTNGGIKFKGNDDREVTTALGSKLNLVGEGTVKGETASDNIKVEKGDSTDKLTFKLSKDLKNLKSIELKDGDNSSKLTLNETGDVTIGGNKIVTSNNIGAQTLGYKAGTETTVKTTTLISGLHFKSEGTNLSVKSEDGGVVTYSLKETNSINKTAGTTENSENKLTTEKAVVDYVKNEISGVNTNIGNVSLTLSKDGTEETSKINLKDDKLTVKGENGIDVSIVDKAVTLKLSQTVKDKLDNISSKSDGRDGKDGTSGTHGLTAKDGLNGKDLTSKVNALRNGEAGSVVFTNDKGERVIKGNDGKYYKPDQLTDKGEPKEGAVGVENPELRLVNADGSTTKATTLSNIASALGAERTENTAVTPEKAQEAVKKLLEKTTGLDKAVNLADLQALAQAGLDFSGNDGSTHRALGTTLSIKGKSDVTSYDTDYTSDNVATKVTEGNVEIGFKKSPTFENVTAKGKVTTPELVLKGKDGSADATLKADDGKVKVNDKEIVTKDDLTTAISNKIKLTGDANTSTSEVALNKEGGISFGIKGTDGIETTASGTDVTLKLSQTVKDKLDNISSKSDGRDGKDGTSGTHGLTAKDGLNGKDLTSKVNALRNGEAGSVVFTNDKGERVIKGNDGKYYKPDQLTDKGEPKEGAVGVENPELRLVNADGSTTKATTLSNIASALGAERTENTAVTPEKAQEAVKKLLEKTTGLDKAVNLADLQALAQAGLDFSGNDGSTHRALGTTLNIAGQGTTSTGFVGAEGNINVVASEATADKVAKLEIQLAKALKNIESIQNGETKVTLGENGVSVSGKDGGSISVNGKDGKPGVTINGGNGTSGSINFAKDGDKGTGSITGLKDPDGKDKTAAATVNYVTNQIEGAKTDIANNIKNIVDGGMTYKGNSGEDVKVKLNESLNIKGEGDYTGDKSASGNIAVVGKTDKTLEIKLNKNLNNIESIQNGETKVTLGENGVSVSGKDGGSISVNGKDGKPGVTINGGNGTSGSINFAKDGDKGTGSITGLKDPDGSDKTAVTTVNYVTNAINNATNSLTDKGLNFEGNDGNAVTKKLGETLSIKGEGTVTGSTATNNIKVSKDTTGKSTGLVVGLAEKLTGMTGFETKEEDGKKVSIDKDGITFAKNGENGTGVITGLKDSTDKTSAVTRGTYDKFVKEIESKLDKSGSIKYSADKGTSTVALDKGMTFNGDGNITTEAKDNGIVEFKLNKNITLGSKEDLGTIKGIKTVEGDPTSVATVDYVESKVGDSVKVSHKALVGVANAVAMANLPQVNSVGNNRHVVSAAYGNYEGQNALALGISGINKERTFIYRGSASLNTNGKIALGAGIGYQFGKDDHDEIQNDASIKVLKEEIAALKDKDSKNTNVISELKELMKKKDVENDYKTYRLEEENKVIKSYIEELRKENEKTREELNKLLDAFKSKK